ncbi:MAG: glutamate-ammonia-ligase adenylyltransferase [Deltaproteobacteria bacterium]|nr:glutamate-ammonia-ligase adenylyltransferase [Deltaproteobacteria bacterium]
MKPDLESLKTSMPETDEDVLKGHLNRLSNDYFRVFSEDHIRRHVSAISMLSSRHPVEVIIERTRDDELECTVLSFDYKGVFSLITGILAGTGFNVMSGDVYTYSTDYDGDVKQAYRNRRTLLTLQERSVARRKIIDFFSGRLLSPVYFETWADQLRKNLEEVIGLLERGDEQSFMYARNRVNEMVVKHLSGIRKGPEPVLYPVEINISNEGPFTQLKIISEDTPAFLYSLSNALSLHGILLEHMRIRTIRGRVEDLIDLVDSQGRKIEDSEILDRIKLSVLLTKEFTYFLVKAPDPYAALSRFEQLLGDILSKPFREEWIAYLGDSSNLQDFARLLGASDFLWEDFIRLQYESLLPLLKPEGQGGLLSGSPDELKKRLDKALEGCDSLEKKKQAVNAFKDQEIFLIDLDHILNRGMDIKFLAERLTALAEMVVNAASDAVYTDLVKRHGRPASVAGLYADFAVLGLGKFGGAALGYASDIELMFVYNDNGMTDGEKPIENSEFFNLLAKGVNLFIESKREGIFQVDLRLRPHGESGPLACSMETFCGYYGKEGQAHSYELLSLVRMRAIGGDPELGRQLERIRDDLVYFSGNIDISEIRNLREKQFREKSMPGKVNAKFSPGGLVDLEYGVQILQVIHGKDIPQLRTARIHEALTALSDAGIMSEADTLRLMDAYYFFRNLINGLRMLRGNAKDLFLPSAGTNEFGHLARRMGYERGGPLDTAQKLYLDFETHSAMVRVMVERYFGRKSLPDADTGTVVDVILSDKMPEDLRNRILSQGGFRDPQRAYINLMGLAGEGSRRDLFTRIALLAWDMLKRMPDPDMALNNWDRFIHSFGNAEFHYSILLSQPMHLEILLAIFSGSQFLSDTLIRNPFFFDWLTIPDVLHRVRRREDIETELRNSARTSLTCEEWLNKMRRFRRREILRIGTRDIYLGISPRIVMQELTALAEALTQVALEERLKKAANDKGIETNRLGDRFCIIAFGKMGGNELNYSSDIDLLGVFDGDERSKGDPLAGEGVKEIFSKLMGEVISDLSSYTEEGYAYRVDMRLRPFGSSGELISSIKSIMKYYEMSASLWEIQAAIKMRPVAGNLLLGYDLMKQINAVIKRPREHRRIAESIDGMRKLAVQTYSKQLKDTVDIKSGIGGIRDVEFMVQGLQLMHAPDKGIGYEGNTMLAIESLSEAGILPYQTAESLKEDYVFLRRTEHCLQLLEDRQVHAIPGDRNELSALSKRMLGVDANADQFMDRLNACLKRVREIYKTFMLS